MNELEQLREAMRATEWTGRASIDVAAVMRTGRRLRRRRRLAATGVAALALAVAVGVPVGLRSGGPDPSRRAVPAASAPVERPTPTPTPDLAATRAEPAPRPIGTVVRSGIRYGADERVFYLVPVDVPDLPQVTIGLVAGRRTATGELVSDYLVNDVSGRDRRPGFHEIGYDEPGPSRPAAPTFGYFVGPAEQIIGTVDGREIVARQARWSEDAQVVIFWFDPKALPPGVRLDGIIARDAHGRRL
ncbi:hypothetical protein [Micromonospora costi]|uniref:Uncharacterized protein n=1 Tax=Micromonospora costi TaxID=1530042 RepID=A0A3A9ZYD3_9ACTN|nr:hypothetical protein [Micromonospora costi]RKN53241.1 hypothetical protein D7193_23890 [Micromonospora costi]